MTFSIRARWLRTALVVAVTAAIVAPVTAFASDRFTDVPSSNVFHDDISWLADAAVTLGCNPPDNTRFCPDQNVTREQMAAFLRRLAENRVVDADTVDGQDASAFLAADAKADDADLLDGNNGVYYERPLAMKAGSFIDGTQMADQNGEIARVQLEAPAAGTIKVEHTASWDYTTQYTVATWVEPHQPGAECDSFIDGDAIPGTLGAAGDNGDTTTAGTSAGDGFMAAGAGTNTYSLCLLTESGSSLNLDWSVQAAWYPPAGFATAEVASSGATPPSGGLADR